MKTCARIAKHPRTGEPIEVHDDSDLISGPTATLPLNGEPAVIYARFACVHCGHVTDWARTRKTTGDPSAEIDEVRALKPTSARYREGAIFTSPQTLTTGLSTP